MGKYEITIRRKQILRFVRDFRRGHGYPPSIREIALEFGLSANSTVHAHLVNLERAGYLSRSKRRPRSMRLTSKGAELLGTSSHHPEAWPKSAVLELERLKRRISNHLEVLHRVPWEVLEKHCPEAERLLTDNG